MIVDSGFRSIFDRFLYGLLYRHQLHWGSKKDKYIYDNIPFIRILMKHALVNSQKIIIILVHR